MKRLAVIAGFLLSILVLATVYPDLPYHSEDSSIYLRMAQLDDSEALRPFAIRIMHTGVAGAMSRGLGLSLDTAFLMVALLSCWFLASSTFWIHQRSHLPSIVTILTVFTWYTAVLLRDATLPDMLNAGLIALCLAVMSTRPWWALVFLGLATLGRETTMLLALTIGVLALLDGRRTYGLAAVVVGGVALVIVNMMTSAANVHDFGGALYMITKAPFNLSRNVFGCELWVNTIDYCEPRWTWELPSVMQIGSTRSVGYCGFNAVRPLTLFVSWLGNFGVLPAMLVSRRGELRAAWPQAPLWLKAALVYGLVLFVLAPAAGTQLPRLVGYGWPAFWLAVPLMVSIIPPRVRDRWLLAGLHMAAAWGAHLLRSSFPVSEIWLCAALLLALACNLAVARMQWEPGSRLAAS